MCAHRLRRSLEDLEFQASGSISINTLLSWHTRISDWSLTDVSLFNFSRQPAQMSALRKRTRMQAEKLLLSAVERRHANTRGDSFETRSAKIGIGAATLLSFSQCESHATRCALTSRSTRAHTKGACWHPSMKRHRCCSMVRAGFSGGHITTLIVVFGPLLFLFFHPAPNR